MLLLQLYAIEKFANAKTSSRNMVEGQKIVNSGLIFMCGASSRSSTKIELYALCLKTSALSSPEPHVLTRTLSIHHEDTMLPDELDQFDEHHVDPIYVRVKSMNCSCKAGTSHSCKHIVGVLLYCNRKDLNSLPMLSSTDMQCLWNKQKRPFLEQFEAQNSIFFNTLRPVITSANITLLFLYTTIQFHSSHLFIS
ncbi:uncharacterized protein LOC117179016 [Belonocnema kinseyi]|uniref:uncharacterized protein LOC117179016 n=1 Tax=Belonocnema kinseyi TaxID=2817044 RepID=UPI00143DD5CF|nr:uncharacterized protein LOC117179016 [Belonocnema kinseyi]